MLNYNAQPIRLDCSVAPASSTALRLRHPRRPARGLPSTARRSMAAALSPRTSSRSRFRASENQQDFGDDVLTINSVHIWITNLATLTGTWSSEANSYIDGGPQGVRQFDKGTAAGGDMPTVVSCPGLLGQGARSRPPRERRTQWPRRQARARLDVPRFCDDLRAARRVRVGGHKPRVRSRAARGRLASIRCCDKPRRPRSRHRRSRSGQAEPEQCPGPGPVSIIPRTARTI